MRTVTRSAAVATAAVCALWIGTGWGRAETAHDPGGIDLAPEIAVDGIAAPRLEPGGSPPIDAVERARAFKARALQAERAGAGRAARFAAAKADGNETTTAVDCTKGKRIQDAIDQTDGPLVVEVHGICQENVRIERQRVTLRGQDPATDGIRGVVASPQPAALEIHHVDGAWVENLSISDGPALGVGLWFSRVGMENCRIERNGGSGLFAVADSFLSASGLTVSENAATGITALQGGEVFCQGCDAVDNVNWAGRAIRGGVLTYLDSVVSGARGLLAIGVGGSSYVDIDCVSVDVGHPCSLTANFAAWAAGPATAALFGSGDFSGNLLAEDHAYLYLLGARQLSTGTTGGGGPQGNSVSRFSTLLAEPSFFGPVPEQSLIKGDVHVDTFSRAVLQAETVVDGTIHCDSAGDAWTEPGVVFTPGSTTVGCEHAPPPAP